MDEEKELEELECLSAVLGPRLDADGNCLCCGEKWEE